MMTGRVIEDHPGDANLGLAIDHALLITHAGGVTLRLWRNPRSVIIGRSQSPSLEADEEYCRANGVIVCRRISGGGAVYQDEGNLNISLVYPRSALERIDNVSEATCLLPSIIMESLRRNGVDRLSIDRLNTIYKDGFKVSGAAAYLKSDVVLSHSTLLLSADLRRLEKSLLHLEGVKRGSRYSPTTNLRLDVGAWRPRRG
jgi:lipoate-protein ligase A